MAQSATEFLKPPKCTASDPKDSFQLTPKKVQVQLAPLKQNFWIFWKFFDFFKNLSKFFLKFKKILRERNRFDKFPHQKIRQNFLLQRPAPSSAPNSHYSRRKSRPKSAENFFLTQWIPSWTQWIPSWTQWVPGWTQWIPGWTQWVPSWTQWVHTRPPY